MYRTTMRQGVARRMRRNGGGMCREDLLKELAVALGDEEMATALLEEVDAWLEESHEIARRYLEQSRISEEMLKACATI